MSKPARKIVLWSALVLMGASCTAQTTTVGDTTATLSDARNFNGMWQFFTADLTQFLLAGEEISLTEYGEERYRGPSTMEPSSETLASHTVRTAQWPPLTRT